MAPQDQIHLKVGEPMIQVRDVNKKYGDKVVHEGITLDIRKGEVLTLMGGSGSGKSVLLRASLVSSGPTPV